MFLTKSSLCGIPSLLRSSRFLHLIFVVETGLVATSTIVAVLYCPPKICLIAQLAVPHVDDVFRLTVQGFWNA